MPSTFASSTTPAADDSLSPLADSSLDIVITDLLAEYELRHHFRNAGDEAIEAVYTFPVPLDAAFLGMTATLAGDTLTAQLLPARQADHHYDDALGTGDSAVLLEQLEPGLLCVNLGNLMPGETGEIVLRFVAALGVAEGVARFSLPLVHRPRYGRYGFDDAAVPSHDFAVEHPLQAHIRIRGLLASCPVQCASAGARFTHASGETALDVPAAMLNRDFVLRFELSANPPPRAALIEDGDDSIALLSFCVPPSAATDAAAPRDICLLLDGSGSMNGDAIAQSRQALLALAEALQPQDRIQTIRFGSHTQPLFRRPLRATPTVKDALRQLAPTVDADLGGTEIGAALEGALDALTALDGPVDAKVVILVTDGAMQPQALRRATRRARLQRVRIFVVAVGSSAGVEVLCPLAEGTGATLERAVPAEPIDASVLRQLARARSQPLQPHIEWGSADARPVRLGPIYPGDAVTALALCTGQAARTVAITVDGPAGFKAHADTGTCRSASALRAWAGLQVYARAAADQQETVALRYGLITPHSKAVLVKQRSAQDKDGAGLPKVMPVAHMVPEGMLDAHSSSPPARRLSRNSLRRIGDIQPKMLTRLASSGSRSGSNRLLRFILQDEASSSTEIKAAPSPLSPADAQRLWDAIERAPEADASGQDNESLDALPDERDRQALAQALADLLLSGIHHPDFSQLLARLEPARHAAIAALVGHCLRNAYRWRARDAVAMLRLLLDAGARLTLDDDQEARLAVLLGKG